MSKAGKIKILIVEDSPTQAEQLRYILEKQNYEVIQANDGNDALGLLSVIKPSLVISDIIMPGLNGYELCKKIKEDKSSGEIPVILLTSLTSKEDVIEGLACGADSFINKPCTNDYLISHVEKTLAGSEINIHASSEIKLELSINGKTRLLTLEPAKMLTLLVSTYEAAINRNNELIQTQQELKFLNENLETAVIKRTAELQEEITAHKRADALLTVRTNELQRSNEELAQFAYIASHDLQEPLRMVASFVQLLSRKYSDKLDTNAKEYIEFAVDGATRMQKMIQDLLEFSRIQTRGKTFAIINTNELLKHVINNLLIKIQETGALITYDSLPDIYGDESQILRLFQNLIDNGLKFHSAKKPEIHISSSIQADFLQFSFKDNGIGVDEKYQDKIFQIFQRLHTRAEYDGTGIGLSLCKRICERHQGKIWFTSVPGEGTTFYFTLKNAE